MRLQDCLARVDNDYPLLDWKSILALIPQITASFVIPVYNSEDSIIEVLEAIEAQELGQLIREVIIIDDGSTDQSGMLIREYIAKSALRVIYRRNKYRRYAAFSRNRGTRLASADVICFIDSDIVVPPDYLNYHLSLHQQYGGVISLSFRCFIDKEAFLAKADPFPVQQYTGEFRIEAHIKQEWCDTREREGFAGKTVRLLEETDYLRGLGNGKSHFWTLPEVCLTCSVTYKREDVLRVKGSPENFVGWGGNDISMAAKIISLGRYVVPVTCGVYHLKHPERSGGSRGIEFAANRIRYRKMLTLEQENTFEYFIVGLDEI